MRAAKVATTIEEKLLERIDRMVEQRKFRIGVARSRRRCARSSSGWIWVGSPVSARS